MKKLLCILVAVLLIPAAVLAGPDVSSMTDQELRDLISQCSAELMARNNDDAAGVLIFDESGVRVYQIGEAYINRITGRLMVRAAIYNDTEYNLYVGIDKAHCNGWDIQGGCGNVSAHSKSKNDLYLTVVDADVSDLSQIDSLSFAWTAFSMDTFDYYIYQETPEEYRFW